MAKDCLQTILKGISDNADLPIFGELRIKLKNASAASGVTIVGSTTQVDGTDLVISDKYAMTQLNAYAQPNSILFNMDDLKYCGSLTRLNVSGQIIKGDVANLPKSITYFLCGSYTGSSPWISGGISMINIPLSKIYHITSLTDLLSMQGYGMTFTGAIEDFVAAQIALGRTSCNEFNIGLKVTPTILIAGNITYNNVSLTGERATKFTWNWDGSSANITKTTY